MIKLGLLREYKQPADKRVALSPEQCVELQNKFHNVKIIVEPSPDRIFPDDLYKQHNIELNNDLSECDYIFGIKEIPIEYLRPNKTYFIFSHTIKKQSYNREKLQFKLKNNIRLIDYECLKWPNGSRVIGFGKYAGWVGTYEAILSYAKRIELFNLQAAYKFQNFEAVKSSLIPFSTKLKQQNTRIVITGSGRVSAGCEELLAFLGITKVSPEEYINQTYHETVFTVLDTHHLYQHKENMPWNHAHFFNNHSDYKSIFKPYTFKTDILINGIYWDVNMAPLFTKVEATTETFTIKTIADISCDIEGSVPITLRETKMNDPVMGWNKKTLTECEPYLEDSIDIMAVSNLPSEIPADASEGFGEYLIHDIIPELLKEQSEMITEATICENGDLTESFEYLRDYINE